MSACFDETKPTELNSDQNGNHHFHTHIVVTDLHFEASTDSGHHFANTIFHYIFFNKTLCIVIKFIPMVLIHLVLVYIYNIYSQPIHIIWYKWYWHNSCLEQYNTSNKTHINPARSQPYPNPIYISFNMWLWIQVPVRYPQVQECQLAPVHPWHAPTHESVPLWELHQRRPCTKEGPASLCWVIFAEHGLTLKPAWISNHICRI